MKTFILWLRYTSIYFYCSLTVVNLNAQIYTQKGLDIIDKSLNSYFGHRVSMSSDGKTIAIGAPFKSTNHISNGEISIYEWNGSNWLLKGNPIIGSCNLAQYGHTIKLNATGNVLAIGNGSPHCNNQKITSLVYEWNGKDWKQRGCTFDGYLIGLSGNGYVAALQSINTKNTEHNLGSIQLYYWTNGVWEQLGNPIQRIRDYTPYKAFGTGISSQSVSLSFSGLTIAFGHVHNSKNGYDSGQVRIYEFIKEKWTPKGAFICGSSPGEWLGSSVDISEDGQTLAVNSPHSNNKRSGKISIFQWKNKSWKLKGQPIKAKSTENFIGSTLSLSGDGNTVISSYRLNSLTAPNYIQSYKWSGGIWEQIGEDIFTQGILGDLSINLNGHSFALGAYQYFDERFGGTLSKVASYELTFPIPVQKSFSANNIRAYSNYEKKLLQIKLGKIYKTCTLKIHNQFNQHINTFNYNSSQTIHQNLNTPAGVYFLEVSTENIPLAFFKIIIK